jgi:hypothetical protein
LVQTVEIVEVVEIVKTVKLFQLKKISPVPSLQKRGKPKSVDFPGPCCPLTSDLLGAAACHAVVSTKAEAFRQTRLTI